MACASGFCPFAENVWSESIKRQEVLSGNSVMICKNQFSQLYDIRSSDSTTIIDVARNDIYKAYQAGLDIKNVLVS